ncbi:unnamed protein product [Lactuca saligna]|uniref:CCHC-type domain-containing protein n=1 Tax=Lactuca saligna TaxID=75948 RepID=A0AA36EN00_LACSI|nr:unnamed protein product [Lactuca saligna]
MFGSCYRYPVKPINGDNMCPDVLFDPILPPRRRRMLGRPKVNRMKCPIEKNEGRHTINKTGMSISRCSNCHQEGHNKRRCPLLTEASISTVGEGAVEEGVSQDGISEDGVNEGVSQDGVSKDGIGEEEDVEEGDIEDHQEDEIERQDDEINHQVDEIDHQENHVEGHQEDHIEDHQEGVVQDEAHHIEVVQDEANHEEAVDHHEPNFDEVHHHQHQPVFFQHFVANKRRLPSERITKLKLRKKVVTKDGSGECLENPVTLN